MNIKIILTIIKELFAILYKNSLNNISLKISMGRYKIFTFNLVQFIEIYNIMLIKKGL